MNNILTLLYTIFDEGPTEHVTLSDVFEEAAIPDLLGANDLQAAGYLTDDKGVVVEYTTEEGEARRCIIRIQDA